MINSLPIEKVGFKGKPLKEIIDIYSCYKLRMCKVSKKIQKKGFSLLKIIGTNY